MPPAAVARRQEPAARNALSNAPRWSPYRAIRRFGPAAAAAPIAPARPSHAGNRKDEGRPAQSAPKRNAAPRGQGAESRRPTRIERCRRPCPGSGASCPVRPIPRVNADRAGPGFSPRTKKNGGEDAISTRTKVALIRDFERRIPRKLPRFCRLRCHARRKKRGRFMAWLRMNSRHFGHWPESR